MFDSVAEREKLSKQLNEAIIAARGRGKELAEAERAYKIANAKKIIELKTQGYPATLILELAKGDVGVADLRYKRDALQVLYKSAMEFINVSKIQLKIVDNEINQERRGL